jgi:drug/metabolite transporter (DMT)-like permease
MRDADEAMDTTVFTAVLLAAAMHAGWNAIIKIRLEPLLVITLISVACGVVTLPLLPFVNIPSQASWPFIAASLIIHLLYYYALGEAYRTGDLGHVYPIARGTAPLLTAIGAFFLVGETPGQAGTVGIIVLTSGIILLSFKGGRTDALFDRRAVGFALLTAVAISAYTLVDGIGARKDPGASGYIVWLIFLDGVMMLAFGFFRWGRTWLAHPPRTLGLIFAAGILSAAAYGIAIWAMTQAPIARVAALRETSVLFAAAIGIFILREPVLPVRLIAAALVLTGVLLVRLKS